MLKKIQHCSNIALERRYKINKMNNRIKTIRANANKNQTEFAESINVGQATISAIEKGTRELTDRVISDVCRVYNVNEEWLRYGTGEMYREMTKEEETLQHLEKFLKNEQNQLRKDIIYAIAKLPPEAWDSIENFIYDLTKKKDS